MTAPTLANLFTLYSPQSTISGSLTNVISAVSLDSTGKILTTTFAEALTPDEQWGAIFLAGNAWFIQNTDASVMVNASNPTLTSPVTRNSVSKSQITYSTQLFLPVTTIAVDVTGLG